MKEYVEQIRRQVLKEMDVTRSLTDEEVFALIDQIICTEEVHAKSLGVRSQARMAVFHSLRGLDVLQELIEDKAVTEIMVNGPEHIFYEKKGRLYQWEKTFYSNEKLEDVIQNIVSLNNRIVNEASPIVDTRLLDGSRVNIVLHPIAIDGSAITIRKFPSCPMDMSKLIRLGSVSEEMARLLQALVVSGYNIFVSGGTGSGKTTFLNALSGFIPEGERVVTIEDSAELQLEGMKNVVRLETRPANLENVSEITIRQLIRSALRMRPDRIIVGECRGAEALDMLQAMNTGHDGSLSTGHANSCQDMIARLETMVLMGMELPVKAIRGQISSGIDIFIHLGRLRDRSRKVLDIMEVDGMEEDRICLNPLYHYIEDQEMGGTILGHWEKVNELRHTQKLKDAGIKLEDEALLLLQEDRR